MGSPNREMEFSNYLDFLVKLTCAVFSIDPGEINFYMQAGSGGGGSMFESNQEQKLKMSKDKGLRPLLSAVARWINQFIINKIAPEYYFSFTGIDSKDEKEIIELRTKEVGAYKTVDEVRDEAGLKPLGPEAGGDLILNQQFMQFKQQQSMEAMQNQEGEEDPQEDEDGEGVQESKQGTKTDQEQETDEDTESDEPTDEEDEIKKSLRPPSPTKFLKITLED